MKFLVGNARFRTLLLLGCLFTLTGCKKIIDWGKDNFRQAPQHAHDFFKSAQPFIRSVPVYHQFTTVAQFDVMLLSDQMRMIFADYHKKTYGLSAEQDALMRQKQFNENRYFIAFYVIVSQKNVVYMNNKSLFTGEYQKTIDPLGMKDAMWHLKLLIDDKDFYPESIKSVELPPEYRMLFGPKYNQFNAVYLVRFAAKDRNNNLILPPYKKENITLQFMSAMYQADVTWKNLIYSGV